MQPYTCTPASLSPAFTPPKSHQNNHRPTTPNGDTSHTVGTVAPRSSCPGNYVMGHLNIEEMFKRNQADVNASFKRQRKAHS